MLAKLVKHATVSSGAIFSGGRHASVRARVASVINKKSIFIFLYKTPLKSTNHFS